MATKNNQLAGLDSEEIYALLPEVMHTIAALIGIDGAVKLAKEYGGTALCIHEHMPEAANIAALIGEQSACKLLRVFDRENLDIPSLTHLFKRQRNLEMRKDRDEGMGINAMARKYQISRRSIQRNLAKMAGKR
jgi:hypothetical protein